MYNVFQKDGFDYFTDMMPALHNYVTVDTKVPVPETQVIVRSYVNITEKEEKGFLDMCNCVRYLFI